MSRTKTLLLLAVAGALVAPHRGGFGDPVGNYNFRVEISGFDAASFQAVEGLGGAFEVIESPTGGPRTAGPFRFSDITLERGYTGDGQFFASLIHGDPSILREVSIDVVDPRGEVSTSFDYDSCFLQSASLGRPEEPQSAGVLEERITFVCQRLGIEHTPPVR